MEEKKMNVFKELVMSTFDFEAYKGFLKNKGGKVFGYGLLLTLIFFMLTILIPAISFNAQIGGFANALEQNVPDFEFNNSSLWIEKPFLVEYEDTYVDINTDNYFNEDESLQELLEIYRQALLVDSQKVILKDKGEIQTLYFSDMPEELSFSKQNLIELVPMAYIIIIVCMLFIYIFLAVAFFFGVLFLSLIGMIIASIVHVKLTFGQIFMLGVYARTLPVLIKGILGLANLTIPCFWILSFALSSVYLIFAFKKINTKSEENELNYDEASDDLNNDL